MELTREPQRHTLFEAAQRGEPLALGELLNSYANYLSILSTTQLDHKLRGRISPSDIVQETYVEAARDFPQFRGHTEEEFSAWLRQILVQNLARAVERHVLTAKRDVRRELSMEELQRSVTRSSQRLELLVTDPGDSPSGTCENRQRGKLVADLLAQLPSSYRDVVILRNFQGLCFRDIANQLNRSEGAVRMLWLRALQRLRELLREVEL